MNLVRNIKQASLLAGIFSAILLISSNPAAAEQKACVITREGATVCGKLTSLKPPSNNPQPTATKQVQIDKFTFDLKGCKRDGKNIKCIFEIANIGKEQKDITSVGARSYILDSTGTSYQSDSLDMGGSISTTMTGRATIVPGIESFASINIPNVPSEVTQARVLEFFTDLGGKKVQFRNVPISD